MYTLISVITQRYVHYKLFGKRLQDNTLNFVVQVSSKPDDLLPKTAIPARERSVEGSKAAAAAPPPHSEADLCFGLYYISFGLDACSRLKELWACERTVLRCDSSRHTLRSCQG